MKNKELSAYPKNIKKNLFIIFLIFFAGSIFADVTDLYNLHTQDIQIAYQHKDGWRPIKREFDNNYPLTIMFYPTVYRGFIGTLDTSLYLKACLILTEAAKNLCIKSIIIKEENKREFINLNVNKQFSILPNTDGNLLYNEDGTLYEYNNKKVYFLIFDLDLKISGRKVRGKKTKKITVTIDYLLDDKIFTSEVEYLCIPHKFTFKDFLKLFVTP